MHTFKDLTFPPTPYARGWGVDSGGCSALTCTTASCFKNIRSLLLLRIRANEQTQMAWSQGPFTSLSAFSLAYPTLRSLLLLFWQSWCLHAGPSSYCNSYYWIKIYPYCFSYSPDLFVLDQTKSRDSVAVDLGWGLGVRILSNVQSRVLQIKALQQWFSKLGVWTNGVIT